MKCLEKKSELVSPSLTPPIQQITTRLRKGVQGLCVVSIEKGQLSVAIFQQCIAEMISNC
jgi:hypothetical protein